MKRLFKKENKSSLVEKTDWKFAVIFQKLSQGWPNDFFFHRNQNLIGVT